MQRNKILFICCLGATVLAQTPKSPPSPQSTPTAPITQIEEEKIKEIRDQVREKVQGRIQEIKEKGSQKAYVGEILKIENLQITLESQKGSREITLDEKAKIIGPKKESFEPEDLKVGEQIIGMGNVDTEGPPNGEAGKMIAKRIVVVPQLSELPLSRRAIYGQVSEIDKDPKILTLIHPQKEETIFQVKITKDTKVTKKLEGKMQNVKFADVEIDDRLAAVGTWDEENEILTAKIIHIIPGQTKVLPD